MYIEPNSTIKVLRGIPWDNTYQHTPRFASRDAQTTYMNSKVAFTLGKHTYVREGRGYLKVEKNVEELIGCNYLMFQNPKADGTMGKVFYAFITATEYINPVTTEIRYEIDVMQTWFLDCKLGQCFIERSHSATDKIGDNLVAEDFSVSEYVATSYQDLLPGGLVLCAMSSMDYNKVDKKWSKIDSFVIHPSIVSGCNISTAGNLPEGHEWAGFPSMTELDPICDLIKNYPEAVLGLFYVPKDVFTRCKKPHPVYAEMGQDRGALNVHIDRKDITLFEGYSVKNKKLYTYPYSYLELSNHQDEPFKYKFEMFNRAFGGTVENHFDINFEVTCDPTADPTVIFIPKYYNHMELDYDHIATLTNMPNIPYAGDVYKQWLARNRTQRSVAYQRTEYNALAGGIKAGMGLKAAKEKGDFNQYASGLNQAVGAYFDAASMLAKEMDMAGLPGTPVGGKGASGLFNAGCFTMGAKYMSITYEQAKRIDDFFTVFGYAQRCVGVPDITSRKYWNYIKLVNPSITPINGGIPADDISAIVKILTNGITFWHNANNIGNYSLDNSV